jgi:oligosaccharide repeat unit polymerase
MYASTIGIILLIMTSISRYILKNWAEPAHIMLLYWSTFIISSLIVFKDSFRWNYFGLLWIIFACLFFWIGHEFGKSLNYKMLRLNTTPKPIIIDKKLSSSSWVFLIICTITGLLRTVTEVSINGLSFKMFFNIDSLINMNTFMAYNRYYGDISYGWAMQVMLIFTYAAPFCGGYAIIHSEEKSKRLLSYLTFTPVIANLLLTNAKSGIIACSVLWISGYLVAYIEKYRKAPSINYKRTVKLGSVGLFIIMLLYFSMLLRIGDLSSNTRAIVNNKIFTYALGSIPAFDYYFGGYTSEEGFSLGINTFMGVSNILGLTERVQGVYSDLLVFEHGESTNVYTAFRGLILDYGIIGSLIFLKLYGMTAGYAFGSLLKKNKQTIIVKVFLASIYFFIFQSLLSSSFTYTSHIFSFLIFAIYLWLTDPKERLVEVKSN